MNKRFTAIVLSAAMTLTLSASAFAEEDVMPINDTENETVALEQISDTQVLDGKIISVGENSVEFKSDETDYILNTSEETIFSDKDGIPMGISELSEGDSVIVYASAAETRSIPAQVNTYAIIKHDGDLDAPIYMEISEIETNENGKYGYSKDGMYKISISDETEYAPFKTRQAVFAEDITEGSKVLVFSKIMTMSIPALMNPEKIILVSSVKEDSDVNKPLYTISINDNSCFADPYNKDGIEYLPVRSVSEALGYDVNWDDTLKSVTVGTVPMGVSFNTGVNQYTKAKMMPQELSAAPILVEDRMYVPVDFYTEILGAKVEK